MGYSFRKYTGLLLITLALAIIIRILPIWAWYMFVIVFVSFICFFIVSIFYG